jgi:hypothetical protein
VFEGVPSSNLHYNTDTDVVIAYYDSDDKVPCTRHSPSIPWYHGGPHLSIQETADSNHSDCLS